MRGSMRMRMSEDCRAEVCGRITEAHPGVGDDRGLRDDGVSVQ